MIDAVTYGMIPSANSANCDSAPPEKMLSRDRIVPPCELGSRSIELGIDAGRRDPAAEPVERPGSSP